jgi:hypothetical protein
VRSHLSGLPEERAQGGASARNFLSFVNKVVAPCEVSAVRTLKEVGETRVILVPRLNTCLPPRPVKRSSTALHPFNVLGPWDALMAGGDVNTPSGASSLLQLYPQNGLL